MIIPVEQLQLLDRVRFNPGNLNSFGFVQPIDTVLKLHFRESDFFGEMVTVTHERGCWSKTLGEVVEVLERPGR